MDNIYKMVEQLKEKGLIDGIGLQPTVGIDWPELDSENDGSFRKCLETYAKLGLELQITELNFRIEDGTTDEELLQRQSDRYEEMMRLLVEEDTQSGGPCNITSVTVFGICDDYPLYGDDSGRICICMTKTASRNLAIMDLSSRESRQSTIKNNENQEDLLWLKNVLSSKGSQKHLTDKSF